MATQGPNSAGTGADDATVGTKAWTNPGNVTASDNIYASETTAASHTTHYLKATNFGFSIPSGATINGITVEIERKRASGNSTSDSSIRIVKNGSISTTNRSTGATWGTSDAYVTFGSASDLWGETWTDTDINASTFGVVFSCSSTSSKGTTNQIDHIRITIDYTAAGGGATTTEVARGSSKGGSGTLSGPMIN